MEAKEAIKRIEEFGLYHAIKDLPNSYYTVTAFDMAIDALEKQVPKKPQNDEYGFYHCPHCGADYDSLMHDSNLSCTYNYCTECGQKLNWSE